MLHFTIYIQKRSRDLILGERKIRSNWQQPRVKITIYKLKVLNRIQNTAIGLATGAFRKSPIQAILTEFSSIPVRLRREMSMITYGEKVQSIPNHLNYQCSINMENTHRPTTTKPIFKDNY